MAGFLQHHHVAPAPSEQGGDRRARGPSADHQDVALRVGHGAIIVKSFTAKDAQDAKGFKSFTAKDAKDAKETIIESPTPKQLGKKEVWMPFAARILDIRFLKSFPSRPSRP